MDDIPLLSDTEAAIALVLSECPPGAMLRPGTAAASSSSAAAPPAPSTLPCALVHALHAVIHHATEVDVELERLRLAHTVRVLKLPAYGDERLILRADDYANALARSDCCELAPLVARVALPKCTGVRCTTRELSQALRDGGDCHSTAAAAGSGGSSLLTAKKVCEELRKAGWLVPAAQAAAAEAHAAAPGEAPLIAEADEWLWSLPHAGRLLYALAKCRKEVLKVLHKQHFHRAMRRVVERAPAVRKVLGDSKLDLRYALRDVVGKRLVEQTETSAGTVLELTVSGVQAAASQVASATRKRRR